MAEDKGLWGKAMEWWNADSTDTAAGAADAGAQGAQDVADTATNAADSGAQAAESDPSWWEQGVQKAKDWYYGDDAAAAEVATDGAADGAADAATDGAAQAAEPGQSWWDQGVQKAKDWYYGDNADAATDAATDVADGAADGAAPDGAAPAVESEKGWLDKAKDWWNGDEGQEEAGEEAKSTEEGEEGEEGEGEEGEGEEEEGSFWDRFRVRDHIEGEERDGPVVSVTGGKVEVVVFSPTHENAQTEVGHDRSLWQRVKDNTMEGILNPGHIALLIDGTIYNYGRYWGADEARPWTGPGVLRKDGRGYINGNLAKRDWVYGFVITGVDVEAIKEKVESDYASGKTGPGQGRWIDDYMLMKNDCKQYTFHLLKIGGVSLPWYFLRHEKPEEVRDDFMSWHKSKPERVVEVITYKASAAQEEEEAEEEGKVKSPFKDGDRSPEVKSMQEKLVEKGYLEEGQDDGVYGPTTDEAYQAYMKDQSESRGLWDRWFGDDPDDLVDKEAAAEESESGSAPAFQNGDRGPKVKALQQKLIEDGYLEEGQDDGVYGPTTEKAYQASQQGGDGWWKGWFGGDSDEAEGGTGAETGGASASSGFQNGDRGSGVKSLQQQLIKDGYLAEGEDDGIYGSKTQAAWEASQKDGGGGGGGMFSGWFGGGDDKPTDAGGASATKSTSSGSGFSSGDRGADVKSLQQKLIKGGYLAEGEDDGIYGSKTQAAWEASQKGGSSGSGGGWLSGLFGGGDDDGDSKSAASSAAKAASGSSGSGFSSGDRGAGVKALQQKLIRQGYLAEGQDDGVYGPKTDAAYKASQEGGGSGGGWFDGWFGGGDDKPKSTRERKDRSSDRLTGTAQLQQLLKKAGFDPGPIDGNHGPKTAAAVRAFQKKHGLKVDGIVGPDTRKALMGS